jgi:uncharacterized protein YcbK (DUF882 family)
LGLVSNKRAGKRRGVALPIALLGPVLLGLAAAPSSTESAIANGDTRTISFSNSHTNESGSFTYMVNGYYDQPTLDKLNWFMRDWRLNEPTKMDPKLFDIIWQVYRDSGSRQPIDVLSGYRSPQTNAMLRRRSRQVAEHSQHMQGRAIDAHFIDIGPAAIRDIAMRMQAGGVGFYPIGSTPWIHIDSGSVRYWPRMSRDALTRLFPDGKTVFIPADGQPMPGYELARAEIEARGGAIQTASRGSGFGFLGFLFGGPRGGGADDEEEGGGDSVAMSGRGGVRAVGGGGKVQVASAGPDIVSGARGNLPRGQTYMQPPPDPQPAPVAAPSPASPPAVEAAAAHSEPARDLASQDAETVRDSGEVKLRGPIAAKFIAPLPPKKPIELVARADPPPPAPLPPQRPAAYAVAADESKAVTLPSARGGGDMIAALLERGNLPRAITRGVGSAPMSALSLSEAGRAPEPPERPDMLERAAALTAPLPPARPGRIFLLKGPDSDKPVEVSSAPRAQQKRASGERPRRDGASLTNPYGDLFLDAFNAPAPVSASGPDALAEGLRGSAQ